MRPRTLTFLCALACFACAGFAEMPAALSNTLTAPISPRFEPRPAGEFKLAQSHNACTAACDKTAFRCHDTAMSRKVSGDDKETLIANCLRAQGVCYKRCGVPYP